jgi:FMN reductase
MTVTVLVGNPKPRSRTYHAAHHLAVALTGDGPQHSIDLADFGAALLDWDNQDVARAIEQVRASTLVIVASPTYKATYTGVLKLFLDRIAGSSLGGVTAVPLMLGAAWRHALASDLLLKPVLTELGASCPTRGLFLLESAYLESVELDGWLTASRPQLSAALAALKEDRSS